MCLIDVACKTITGVIKLLKLEPVIKGQLREYQADLRKAVPSQERHIQLNKYKKFQFQFLKLLNCF